MSKYKPTSFEYLLKQTQEPAAPDRPHLIFGTDEYTLRSEVPYDTLDPEEKLREFISFMRSVVSRYEENVRLEAVKNDEKNDGDHYFEMTEDLDEEKAYEAVVRFRTSLRERRAIKNEAELLKPLYDFITANTLVSQFEKVQGMCKTRKDVIDNRRYHMRTDVMIQKPIGMIHNES